MFLQLHPICFVCQRVNVCVHMCVCGVYVCVYMCHNSYVEAEDNLVKLILSLHHLSVELNSGH